MKSNHQSTCKLCLLPRKLVRSHIVPEYMYATVYSEQGALVFAGHYRGFGSEVKNSYTVGEGITEKLLCAECDNERIGSLEGYAKKVVDDIASSEFGAETSRFIQVDYVNFKLFELSILWRASISTHWMFEKIDLGPKHNEMARSMLLNREPGEPHQYGCVLRLPQDKVAKRAMIHSQMDKFKGHFRHTIVTPGIHLEFYVSSHAKSIVFFPLFLQRDGNLPLIKFEKDAWDSCKQIMKKEIVFPS